MRRPCGTLLRVSSNERYRWPVLSAQWLAKWLVFTKMLLSCSVFSSQTPRRNNSVPHSWNVTLVWPQGHVSPLSQVVSLFCWWHFVPAIHQLFIIAAWPCAIRISGQTLVVLSMVTDIVPNTAKLSCDGRGVSRSHVFKPQALSGVKPALKSCATSSDSWRPALTSK